jgi:hypothetical protein
MQVIEGRSGKTDYIRYPLEAFRYEKKRLFVAVGPNEITGDSMTLNVAGDHFTVEGRLRYTGVSPFPQRWVAPGIMGWYTFVPFMECYHAVVSMDHILEGQLRINQKDIDFSHGKGYIEKDWGRSMPSDWVWIQCNHFRENSDISLMISVARIPWLKSYFPGFLSFVRFGGKVYQFATYNRSKVGLFEIEEDYVAIELRGKKAILSVRVERSQGGHLKAPVSGNMERQIAESLDTEVQVTLSAADGRVIFKDTGLHTGLEVVGDLKQYLV